MLNPHFNILPYQKKKKKRRKIFVSGEGSVDRELADNYLCCGLPVYGESLNKPVGSPGHAWSGFWTWASGRLEGPYEIIALSFWKPAKMIVKEYRRYRRYKMGKDGTADQ